MVGGDESVSAEAQATFFTVSDERFFPGTVALLNSLRLTGNEGPLVVLDAGLSHAQRARLEEQARVVQRPDGLSRPQFKAFPMLLNPTGVVVIIDSDMIVTRHLGYIINLADSGKICVFPDHFSQADRWFKEWEAVLELRSPLRRQTFVNGGFIALSITHWPNLLRRYMEIAGRVPADVGHSDRDMNRRAFTGGDQDPLNALLMSEVPADAQVLLPAAQEAHPDQLANTRVVDARTLECTLQGERSALLHYSTGPKAWAPRGWIRVRRRDAYVRLFGRVVCGEDVALRMEQTALPLWLRPNLPGTFVLALLDVGHGIGAAIRRLLPQRASAAVWRAVHRFSDPRRR
jgi:hypothetical protein